MKTRVFIAIILLAVTFSQTADAQRGRRQANPTPEPTPTADTRIFYDLHIQITASEIWVFPQSETRCRLDVPASQQKLIVVPSDGTVMEFPLPGGTPTGNFGCTFEMDVELPESSSYEFFVRDMSVGELDGADLQQSGGLEIALDENGYATTTSTPVPTPGTTLDPTIQPTQEPENQTEYAQIDIFILESFMIEGDGSCKPATEDSPVITIVARDGTNWTRRFVHAKPIEADNTYVPGERGCLSTGRIPYESSETYSIQLNGEAVVEVQGTYFDGGDQLVVIIDESGAVMDSQQGLAIPTPAPTPAPTPTPQPAGDIGDGQYLLRGYLTLQSDTVVATNELCFGTGGYSDIGSGTQVVVRDGNNNVLGIGELEYSEAMTFGAGCTFVFEINVEEARFYQIEMSHRGEMIFTFDDLEEDRWTVFLTLGR